MAPTTGPPPSDESRRSRDARVALLHECGAPSTAVDELLTYCDTPYTEQAVTTPGPLEDEPHVAAWEGYVDRARQTNPFDALRERFVQLRFPVREGISREEPYRRATLKGRFEEADTFAPGIVAARPEAMSLELEPSAGGRVPVLTIEDRGDFESLVRAFTERNEPAAVPPSMGACLVGGLINWHRIATYREAWARTAEDPSDEAWAAEFQALVPRKALYQDRLVLLSAGPYSAVPAGDAGGEPADWPRRSVSIRREHELFHYFTYRRWGRIRTHVLDELLADFAGLVRTDGRYDARLALRFLGLDRWPQWRAGGRVENYVRGKLPDAALPAIGALAFRAAGQLEIVSRDRVELLRTLDGLVRLLTALCSLPLDELASPDAARLVAERLGP
jgi:hypothetical protein